MVVESRPSISIPAQVSAIIDQVSYVTSVGGIEKQNYNQVLAINTTVDPNITVSSNPIDISRFKTKTISGYSTFNGNIKIYVAPTTNATTFYPYPYYTANISSGTTFSFSFTEVFALVRVEVTNTDTTSGNVVVYVTMSVL
jgi:hypothetical protein